MTEPGATFHDACPDAATLRRVYQAVTTSRQCDDMSLSLYFAGHIQVVQLPARGQEVLGSTLGTVLRPDDYLVTYYRGLPEQIAKGIDLRRLWAEYLGRSAGLSKGKGGKIHAIDPDVGIMLNSGIIGAQLPCANGLALASTLRGDDRVTACTFGDGAVNQGSFHESLNLASLWKLPVVFVCANNRYAENTAYDKVTTVPTVSERASAYGMVGITVDGNDAVASYTAFAAAVERARAGEGPTLVEATTFRLSGHNVPDPMQYIPKAELEAAIAADPVPRFRAWLIDQGVASKAELDAIDAEAAAALEEAYAFAVDSPLPDPADVLGDVYGESP